ncbi:MAG: DUF2341 domain-containing protein, partial [bacterium]
DQDTALPFEVEYFSNAQGSEEAIYWVKVPQIDANSSTDKIYIAYGNDPYHADMSNPQAVWDDGGSNYFKGVWHLGGNAVSGATFYDSTSNGYDFDGTGHYSVPTTGYVGEAGTFDGVDDYLEITTGQGKFDNQNWTLSLFYNVVDIPTGYLWSYDFTSHAGYWYAQHLRLDTAPSNDHLMLWNNGSSWRYIADNVAPVVDTWTHIVCGFTSGSQVLYKDGALIDTNTLADTITYSDQEVWIGKTNFSGATFLEGQVDEVRMSDIKRSADWTKLEYYSMAKTNFNGDNGASGGSFINFGSQEATR